MKPRLCLFGTSHLAALRLAWQQDLRRWNLDLTFIGGHGRRLLDHKIEDGILYPTTDEMRENFSRYGNVEQIAFADFDAFVLVGCQIGPQSIGYLYGQARWCSLPSMTDTNVVKPLISDAAVDAILHDRCKHVVGGTLARALRNATNRPMAITSQPRPGTALMSIKGHKMTPVKQAVRNNDGPALSRRSDDINSKHFAGLDLQFLAQPEQTRSQDMLTKTSFIDGAVKLTVDGVTPHSGGDIMHGNAKYGALVLDQISEWASANVKE